MIPRPFVVPGGGAPAHRPPILACVPHAGRLVPAPFQELLSVPVDELWADWYTDQLWSFLSELGISTVATTLSRFVADPNRDPTSGVGNFWSSVVPNCDPTGRSVHRRPLRPDEVALRIEAAHTPFHAFLDGCINSLLAVHDEILLLDLHSFGADLGADVIVGDVDGTTSSSAVTEAVAASFERADFRVAINLRFRGGWTVRRFAAAGRVHAVAIEVNQRTYLDELQVDEWPCVPPMDPARLSCGARRLRQVVEELVRVLPAVATMEFGAPRAGLGVAE